MKLRHIGRRALVLALALVIAAAAAAPASAVLVPSSQKLKVDGKAVECEKYNIDGYNYFKLRDLAMLLQGTGSCFSVGWDNATQTVSVVTGKAYVPVGGELQIRKLTDKELQAAEISPQPILINGKLNSALHAWLIGDYNFFKLADLGAVLGFDVRYDDASNTMVVTSRAKPEPKPTGSARLALTEDAGREYLDRITFLGDSTTYGIGVYYKAGYSELCPPSQIWTPKVGWMGLHQVNDVKILYPATGEELLIKDAAAKAKPDILLITLGIDSIALLTQDSFISYYRTLVTGVQAASPDTKIILNSMYPVAASYKNFKDINNSKINAANGWIEALAEECGVRYLNSCEALTGADGYLPESSQSGDGLHLTGEAYTSVMQYIRTHAYR